MVIVILVAIVIVYTSGIIQLQANRHIAGPRLSPVKLTHKDGNYDGV